MEQKKEKTWKEKRLAEVLLAGELSVMPTDTIYGIVSRAEDEGAVERLYRARGRNPDKPCIILIGSIGQLQQFSVSLSVKQKEALKKYWPGPVSVILDCPGEEFAYLHRGTHTLAFRLPEPAGLQELLLKTGPLCAPSANAEGAPPARTITEARKYFSDSVSFYADAGEIFGTPSKIIKLNEGGSADIIRE